MATYRNVGSLFNLRGVQTILSNFVDYLNNSVSDETICESTQAVLVTPSVIILYFSNYENKMHSN